MNVAIVGYDVEGQASYRYFSRLNANITIFDEAETLRVTPPKGVKVVCGPSALEELAEGTFDIVMRTPSLSPHKLSHIKNVSSATTEFFKTCPASIIGVTGTKGKGTTSSFIASILRAAGKKVHLVGNIGEPALDALADITSGDIVVFELSSFQLWDMQYSPHVAVVLLVEPDHLDVHDDMPDYINAKTNITRWQKPTDMAVYYPHNDISQQIARASSGVQTPYTSAPGAHVKDGSFYINEQKLCSTATVVIPGNHNLDNACAAITAAWQFTHDVKVITTGLNDFKGLPHRIEYVRTIDNIEYYNDSYSSAPSAAVAAIRAFSNPKIMILGGYDRHIDFTHLAKEVAGGNVKRAIIIGETKDRIAQALQQQGFHDYELLHQVTMQQIIAKARAAASDNDVVILSPGCPSFDMFKNFLDRGEQFKSVVNSL